MKKIISAVLIAMVAVSLTACGGDKDEEAAIDTTNTLQPSILSARETMLAGDQEVFIYDFETDDTYKNVNISVSTYKNGTKSDDVLNFTTAITQNSEEDANNYGSIAVILGADNRLSAYFADSDGNVISSIKSDTVLPIESMTYENISENISAIAPVTSNEQILACLVFGDQTLITQDPTQSVILSPDSNIEQAATLDRVYQVKCKFS